MYKLNIKSIDINILVVRQILPSHGQPPWSSGMSLSSQVECSSRSVTWPEKLYELDVKIKIKTSEIL